MRRTAAVLAALTSCAPSLAHDDFSCRACRTDAFMFADDARFDPDTGRNTRNYAPDRPVDFRHMRLEVTIPDMNSRSRGFAARQTLDLAAVACPVDSITLNAEQLNITAVTASDTASSIRHHHDGSKLTISFDPPLQPGQQATLVTEYTLTDPVEGLFWTPETDAWPNRPAQIHSQGQPETNRYWFPSHDSPNERLSTEFIITVPPGYAALSNGRLVEHKINADSETFHWLQEKPHCNYLVTMVVGRFDTVDVAPEGFPVSLPVHVPPGKGPLVEQTYKNTADMMRVFEERFDEPYPWDRYAQVVVWNFGSGGMENTSATTLFDTAIFDEKALQDGDLDGLIAHELAHQWTGDLVTCNTWEHIWLNEGWATYAECLWYEQRDGYENGYLRQVHSNMRQVARADYLDPDASDYQPAMASNVYEHPWEVFRRKADPYDKGSSVLHMLRMKMGDDAFFKGVAEYIDRYKYKTAETDDFRQVLEETSGLSLEQFFDQWCYRAGCPKVRVSATWDDVTKQLAITVEQLQRIDAENPAYAFNLPIDIVDPDSTEQRSFTMRIDQRRHTHSITLDRAPSTLRIDPDLCVLMDLQLDVPEAWLLAMTTDQARLVPRLDAIAALGSHNDPASIRLLADRLSNQGAGSPWFERRAAADALAKLKATDALLAALQEGIDDARPRAAALKALGAAEASDKSRAAELLARHAADKSESYACRAAALESLGKVGDEAHLGIFRAALDDESQHDQVRAGAVKGLAKLRNANRDNLELVARITTPGNYSRTRPDAVTAVAELAEHDEELALDTLEPLLLDPEARTRRAARQAIAKIESERSLDLIDSFIARTRHPAERNEAEELRKSLKRALSEP